LCCSCLAFAAGPCGQRRGTLENDRHLLLGRPEEGIFTGRKAEPTGLADVVAQVWQGQSWLAAGRHRTDASARSAPPR
jgi:hypothetical protein